MKKATLTKKLTAVFLVAALLVTSLVCGIINAYAMTVTITDSMLGIEIAKTTSGYDDNIWYLYTPSQSGIYTLYGLSSNVLATEAYLLEKIEDENGKKYYNQLAYSNSNPDYSQYDGAAKRQFCLKYHLEKDKTYYYAAGWNNPEQTGRSLAVKFINESYDTAKIVSITPSCSAELSWYTDGSWEKDSQGESYYLYSISKIIQNMALTVQFDDGTVISSNPGDSTVQGYPITYTHNQQEVHWYNSQNELYTANTLRISVLDMTVDYEVVINQSAMFTVSGKVVDDYDSTALSGAQLYIGSNLVATSSDDGTFSFAYPPGTYVLTIKGANILERNLSLTVDTYDLSKNDHRDTPFGVVTIDYVNDGIINGRDYAYIKRKLSSSELDKAKKKFTRYINFTSDDYK